MTVSGGIEFHVNPSPREEPRSKPEPYRILVLGDFSGRGGDSVLPPPPDAQILPVDIDTFESRIERIAPLLPLSRPEEGPEIVAIRSLDDFHPDHLWRSIPSFRKLDRIRRRLLDPATFADAAQELAGLAGIDPVTDPRTAIERTEPTTHNATAGERAPEGPQGGNQAGLEDDAATLARLLGRPRPPAIGRTEAAARVALNELLAQILRDEIVAPEDPRLEGLSRSLDRLASERLRAVLHAPAFQSLESTWRSLHHLVSRTGDDVWIGLLDLTKAQMAEDLAREPAPAWRRQLEPTATLGGDPWDLIVAGFAFSTEPDDLRILSALGRLAGQRESPLLAAAGLDYIGVRSIEEITDPSQWPVDREREERWQAFRRRPEARWIGLAFPRVLLRLPYGPGLDPIESFEFEEMGEGPPRTESFLWGHPAFHCAVLLADRFRDGASLDAGAPGAAGEIDDLPSYTYRDERGEIRMTPCAEVLLDEVTAEALQRRGLIPVLSHAHRNLVRVSTLRSVADPPAPLAGRRSA